MYHRVCAYVCNQNLNFWCRPTPADVDAGWYSMLIWIVCLRCICFFQPELLAVALGFSLYPLQCLYRIHNPWWWWWSMQLRQTENFNFLVTAANSSVVLLYIQLPIWMLTSIIAPHIWMLFPLLRLASFISFQMCHSTIWKQLFQHLFKSYPMRIPPHYHFLSSPSYIMLVNFLND